MEPLLFPLRREIPHNSPVERRDSEKYSERSLTRLLQHRPLQIVCGILHVSLVCIHVALILIANRKLEQRIMFAAQRSVTASTLLTVILQAFGTSYTVAMVFTMQQLAISHKLSGSTTLTETHDANTAWLGLGSALLTLRRQLTRPAALYSTLLAVVYLCGIAALHITTPALFSIQTISLQSPTDVKTFGMVNYTAVNNNQDCEYTQGRGPSWYGPLSALSPITSVSQHANFSGLVNGTLYDVVDDSKGQGQIPVNATYFNVTCGTLSDDTFLTSFDSKTGYSNSNAINYNFTVSGRPLLPGDLTILPILLSRPVFVILTTVSFMDSQKNVSGTYRVNYATAPWLPVTTVQRLACTFQPERRNVTVDVKTKLLQGRAPVQTYSMFRTIAADAPSSQTDICDPMYGLQQLANLAMKQSVPASPTWTGPYSMDCGTFCKENSYSITMQEQYLMENLGFPAPFYSTGSNATFLLHDLENAMSNMFATLFWSDANMGAQSNSTDQREQRLSTVKISQPMVRVVASMTPLQIGLAASLVLLTTAAPFFLSPVRTRSKVDTLGILQVLWLLRDDSVAHVVDPTTENLRAAGMVEYDFREDRLAPSLSSN